MIPPALVNPFMQIHSSCGAQGAHQSLADTSDARETKRPETDGGVALIPHEASQPAGYPCCYNCGYREPCDQWCPHVSTLERELRELTAGFEIEPVPEFIRRAVG